MLTDAAWSTESLLETDFIDFDDDAGLAEPYVKLTTQGAETQYLAVLYPLGFAMSEPTIETLSVSGAAAGKITGGASSGTAVVAVPTSTAPLAHDGELLCDSDARLCLYELDDGGAPESLLMVDGTSAQLFGTSYSISLASRGTALLRAGAGGPELIEASVVAPSGG